MDREPKTGDILLLDRRAGVQFGIRPFHLRVISVDPTEHANPGRWVHGYELDGLEAAARRHVYILLEGAQLVTDTSSLQQQARQQHTARARPRRSTPATV